MKDRILITDKAHPVLIEILSSHGFELDYRPSLTYDEFVQILDEYEGVIINTKTPMHTENIRKASKLKFIGRLGSGLDIVDQELAAERGIEVLNAPEGNANAVAEHALGMLLAQMNHIVRADRELRSFEWNREKNRGTELESKTVGVIGVGNNGEAFIKKLAGLNVKVLAFDKYRKRYAGAYRYLTETNLEDVLSQSDIVSLHIPLNEETAYWVDRHFLQRMKKGAVLINTSRGKIVRTADLIDALDHGQIGGACLDVFENEKVSTFSLEEKEMYNRLYQYDNVILTPHVAGWSKESLEKIARVLATKILKTYGIDQ